MKTFQLTARHDIQLRGWQKLSERNDRLLNPSLEPTHIVIVGKYTGLSDAYLSVTKALTHASLKTEQRIAIDWIEAEFLQEGAKTSDPEAYENAWKVYLEN